MPRKDPSGTPATSVLTRLGVAFSVHTYDHEPSVTSYGLEAAQALRLDPDCVFKTLLVDTGDGLVVGVVPVSCQLDLKALATAVGAKRAVMADPSLAERSTGYVLGGISPIGQKRALTTVVDETVELWPLVYVSGGRRGMDLGLAPTDLVRVTQARLAPIAR